MKKKGKKEKAAPLVPEMHKGFPFGAAARNPSRVSDVIIDLLGGFNVRETTYPDIRTDIHPDAWELINGRISPDDLQCGRYVFHDEKTLGRFSMWGKS